MGNLTGEQSKLSDNQKIEFLKIAEVKATGENKTEARRQLAELFYKTGKFEQAAEYFSRLKTDAQNPEQQQLFLARQLEACLRWPNFKLAADLIKNRLSERDLEPNDVVIQSIENYLSNQSDETNINDLIKTLADINVSAPRPKWGEQIKSWIDRFRKIGEPNQEVTQANI